MRWLSCFIFSLFVTVSLSAASLTKPDVQSLQEAQQAVNNNQPSLAIEPLKMLVQKYPDLGQAYRLLGHAYALNNQPKLARQTLVLALAQGQVTSDVLARLYQLDRNENQPLANIAQLNLLMALSPDDNQYPLLLAQTHESILDEVSATVIYTQQLALQPANKMLLLKLGNMAIKENDTQKAVIFFETATRLADVPPAIQTSLSGLYAQLQQYKQSLIWHEKAYPNITTATPQVQLQRAKLLSNIKDWQAAQKLALALVENTHKEQAKDALLLLAQMAMQQKQPELAQKYFEQMASRGIAPQNIVLYLGSLAYNNADYPKAAKYLLLTVGDMPTDQALQHSLILSLIKSNQKPQAKVQIQNYLKAFGMDEAVTKLIGQWAMQS